ncbi:MAG: Hsp20/alpha crystallin family protein [Planctomycetaceae bacterium]|nr:Hsp20/alpha crystallin family protein [Planctomycetaceae bacterium]
MVAFTKQRPAERKFNQLLWPWWASGEEEPGLWEYPADIAEEPNKIVVDAELPGYTSEEVQVDYSRGVLTIRAEHKEEPQPGPKFLSERHSEPMERSFVLPADVDQSSMARTLENGVLHLELPKAAESRRRRIEIKPHRSGRGHNIENGRAGRARAGTGRHGSGKSGRSARDEASE